jgi:hypothetical protein
MGMNKIKLMCPICILTSVVYVLLWVIGLFGFKRFVKYLKFKYHSWAGHKCEKCKNREECQSHN